MPDRIQIVLSLTPLLPPYTDEQNLLLAHPPNMPANPRVLRVAILGAPNAGKSTLSNQLLGRKVCYILDNPSSQTPPPPIFISPCIILKAPGTSLETSLFLSRCFLSPRRFTLLAARLWGSSQRKRLRWWVPATGQRVKLKGPPLVLDLKK